MRSNRGSERMRNRPDLLDRTLPIAVTEYLIEGAAVLSIRPPGGLDVYWLWFSMRLGS
jgi:hypothetical protein